MSANAEFRKNLWLEFTPTRLLAMPLLLVALFFLTWLTDDRTFGSATRSVSLGTFVALCFLWGTHQASESVAREVRERTWDWTRLSAVRPWPLAWGKLFGSTAYTWLGGTFSLLVHLLASPRDPVANGRTAALLVLGALLFQAAGMLAALQALSRDREAPRSTSAGLLLVAFFLVSPVLSVLSTPRGGKATGVEWFGHLFGKEDFAILSLAAFWGWTLAGIRSRLRDEFRMRTLPVTWCAFLLFAMAYAAGFAWGTEGPFPPSGAALAAAAFLAYGAVFLERKDPVALRRLGAAARAGEWRRVAEGVPCFALALPFVLAATAAVAADPGTAALDAGGPVGSRLFLLAGTFFLVRDLSLVLFLQVGPGPKRADLFSLLCLGVLYGLLPGILQAAGAEGSTALFWPRPDRWEASLPGAALQAAVMAWLAVRRWRSR